jgi:hypothetical protein
MEYKELTGTWTSNYKEQRNVIEDLQDFVGELQSMQAPVTIHKNTAPDASDIEDAWHVEIGNMSHTPLYGKFFWWNPSTEHVETCQTNIEAALAGAENYAHIEPIKDNGEVKFFDDVKVTSRDTDIAFASLDAENGDRDYRHSFIMMKWADNYAGNSHWYIRWDNNAAANYSHTGFHSNGAAATIRHAVNDGEFWPATTNGAAGAIANHEPGAFASSCLWAIENRDNADINFGSVFNIGLSKFAATRLTTNLLIHGSALMEEQHYDGTFIRHFGRGASARLPMRTTWWGIRGRPQ